MRARLTLHAAARRRWRYRKLVIGNLWQKRYILTTQLLSCTRSKLMCNVVTYHEFYLGSTGISDITPTLTPLSSEVRSLPSILHSTTTLEHRQAISAMQEKLGTAQSSPGTYHGRSGSVPFYSTMSLLVISIS
jgi:hypothetical protein